MRNYFFRLASPDLREETRRLWDAAKSSGTLPQHADLSISTLSPEVRIACSDADGQKVAAWVSAYGERLSLQRLYLLKHADARSISRGVVNNSPASTTDRIVPRVARWSERRDHGDVLCDLNDSAAEMRDAGRGEWSIRWHFVRQWCSIVVRKPLTWKFVRFLVDWVIDGV